MDIVEILTIGREILDGRVIDTNSVYLAEGLASCGLVPRYAQRVDDDFSRILEAFRIAGSRSDIVLVTGGLGPTSDDITAEALGRFLKKPLLLHADALEQVESFFAHLGRPMTEVQRKQALLPAPCFILPNAEGSAPGFALRQGHRLWCFMPGVPREMKRMFQEQVLPLLPKVEGYRSYSWATQFTSEGELQRQLDRVSKNLPSDFELTYRTRFPENHIGLHAVCTDSQAQENFERAKAEITKILGTESFSEGTLRSLETVVVELACIRSLKIACVESCTGGLLSSRLTDVAGASQSFWASWICYDNAAKERLGVPKALMLEKGAVSAEVAGELARQGLFQLQSMLPPGTPCACLSTTGIAGPSGGTEAKPVGLCYVGLAFSGQEPLVEKALARPGLPRDEYKRFFAQKALDLLRRKLLA